MMIKLCGVLALAGGLAGCGCDQDDLYAAFQAEAVKMLKSPGSAVFQRADQAIRLFNDNSESCAIIVDGWVDSQNGFGALVRSPVSGTAKKVDGELSAIAVIVPEYLRP
jgi:hypothetical protein